MPPFEVALMPNGHGSVNDNNYGGSGHVTNWDTAWQQIDEASPNDADYFGEFTDGAGYTPMHVVKRSFTLPGAGVSVGVITNVRLKFRVAGHYPSGTDSSYYYMRPFVYIGSIYNGTLVRPPVEYTWYQYDQDWATNPATGQPWTWANISALQPGIELASVGAGSSNAGSYARCSWLQTIISYITQSGNRAQLIGPMW